MFSIPPLCLRQTLFICFSLISPSFFYLSFLAVILCDYSDKSTSVSFNTVYYFLFNYLFFFLHFIVILSFFKAKPGPSFHRPLFSLSPFKSVLVAPFFLLSFSLLYFLHHGCLLSEYLFGLLVVPFPLYGC